MLVKILAIQTILYWQLLWQSLLAQQKNTPIKWVVQAGGLLKVNGSTNINKFTCRIINYNTPDTLTILRTKDISLPISGSISLDIATFNCGNLIMTNDLRKTLKYKEFPKLTINFISLSKLPDPTKPSAEITGWVDIELAGVKKRILVNYSFTAFTKDNFRLTGKKDVNFSDFNLVPPRKLGGMIKTNERLDIAFELTLDIL